MTPFRPRLRQRASAWSVLRVTRSVRVLRRSMRSKRRRLAAPGRLSTRWRRQMARRHAHAPGPRQRPLPWWQCLSCNRVDGADGALTPTCNMPSLTPRRSGWRDKSASYMTTIVVRQCACQETEQGDVQRGITATLDTALHRALSPAINPGDGSASYPQQLHRWDLEHMPA